ncbi:uncharacterized protein LOC108904669 isoform X2 [Anoplophora glabripennis]|uniref:uncharacterized protein LOC108904669 isoform X2 n=1 Tax=Anoplophora glabripennis TaxID=217634 RepID=UPI0008754E86|nr:uncharacterized protein LOC108904669 isoform X2 [Anoplophora glabripennis]
MNSNQSTRNVKTRVTRSSYELGSDEGLVEERLKNLLTNAKEQERPGNIFNKIQEVPKLRRSVVTRAVQNVICSTPMPTDKKRGFFCADNSINISPINPISEEAEINEEKNEQDAEQCEKFQEDHKQRNKEAKVILIRASLPIVISDSEDENEVESIQKGENENVKENGDTRIHYGTRSKSKNSIENYIKNIPNNTENLRAFKDKSNNKGSSFRNAVSVGKHESLQQSKHSNRTHSNKTEVDAIHQNTADTCANRNLKNVNVIQHFTIPLQRESSIDNLNILRVPNCIRDTQNDCKGLESPSSSPEKSSTHQDNVNLEKNKIVEEVVDQGLKSIIGTKSQNLSTENRSGKKEPKAIIEEINSPTIKTSNVTYKRESRRKITQKSNSNTDVKSPERDISKENISKNKGTVKDSDVQHQRRISPRKLSFTSKDEDKYNEAIIQENQNISETVKEPVKLSKIPISRSSSKSRDKNPDPTSKNISQKNASTVETRRQKCKKENSFHPVKSPPKRPPRKLRKKKLAVTGNISKINPGPSDILQGKLDANNYDELLRQPDTERTENTTNNELVIAANKLDQSDFNKVIIKDASLVLENNLHNKKDEVKENHPNPEKTLIETGTSPLILTPDKNDKAVTHFKEVVEAGTSPCHFSDEKDIFRAIDSEKAEKLNQLVLKLLGRSQKPLIDNSRSDTGIQKSNWNLLEKNENPSELLSTHKDEQVPVTVTNKEVQTSLQGASESQGLNEKITAFYGDQHSKNSSTDHSDVISDLEKRTKNRHVLYESLKEDLSTNFSSSDEEVVEGVDSNVENRPWRLEESLEVLPGRSSCRLNFLKSAQEIEEERLSGGYNYNKSEDRRNRQKESDIDISLQTNFADYTKKNKLQIYSRMTQYGSEKISQSTKLHPADVDKRSSSPRSVMSDLVISESDSNGDCQSNNQNEEPLLPTKNNTLYAAENKNNSSNEAIKDAAFNSIVQSNTELAPENDNNLSDKNPELPLRATSTAGEVVNESKFNERSTYTRSGKTNYKSTKMQKNKPSKANSIDSEEKEDLVHSDNEILAVPLEDTDPPAMEQTSLRTKESSLKALDKTDKIANSKAEHQYEKKLGNIITSPETTSSVQKQNTRSSFSKNSPVIKPVKARTQKSNRRKKISENDDGVSSTTVDAGDVTGLRRSGRERKAVQRHFTGVIATRSEKILQFRKSTKARTKKTVKEANNEVTKETVPKKKGQRKRKGLNNNEPQDEKVQESNRSVSDALHGADNRSSSQLETHATVINEVYSRTASCSNTVTRKSRRPHCDTSTHDMPQDVISNKRSKILHSNRNFEAANADKCGVSSNNGTNDSEFVNFNGNTNAGEMDCNTNGNSGSNSVEDNFNDVPSQSHVAPNGDFVPQDNLHGVEEFTTVNKVVEKDSGRSTMLKSTSFEESNAWISRPLTGRITKNYKKNSNVCTKISKVLSRSMNISREQEIVNDNQLITVDSFSVANNDADIRSRGTSISQLRQSDNQYINLFTNGNLVSMKFIENVPKYKLVKDNLMVSDLVRNEKDGGTMGYLKVPPHGQKSLHIARKFALFYFVIDGEGFIQVHNKSTKVCKLSFFIVPLGIEYTIINTSKENPLVLGFVKMPVSL